MTTTYNPLNPVSIKRKLIKPFKVINKEIYFTEGTILEGYDQSDSFWANIDTQRVDNTGAIIKGNIAFRVPFKYFDMSQPAISTTMAEPTSGNGNFLTLAVLAVVALIIITHNS